MVDLPTPLFLFAVLRPLHACLANVLAVAGVLRFRSSLLPDSFNCSFVKRFPIRLCVEISHSFASLTDCPHSNADYSPRSISGGQLKDKSRYIYFRSNRRMEISLIYLFLTYLSLLLFHQFCHNICSCFELIDAFL